MITKLCRCINDFKQIKSNKSKSKNQNLINQNLINQNLINLKYNK